MAWFWGVVAFRAFGVGHGLHCPGRLARGRHGSTWRSLGFSGFLVSQGVGEVSPSPFTQEAHRYQDLRCLTLKSPFWKN